MAASTNTPKIVIVGRPNVGKSSLFNRLIGKKRALVHDAPGVTRDLKSNTWILGGRTYEVTDTGGLFSGVFAEEIREKATVALRKADLILFVVDGAEGLVPHDYDIADLVRRHTHCPVAVLLNKIDHAGREGQTEFYALGFETCIDISAEHNRGISVVEDWIGENAPQHVEEPETAEKDLPALVLLGRPNAGKSTLMNALLGENRSIVSPLAGTTTDTVHSILTLHGEKFRLLDTAGVRRKAKTERGIEVLSVTATIRALEESDLAILLIDATVGVHEQDEKVAGLAEKAGTSVILAINKIDAISPAQVEELREEIWRKMGFIRHAPILELSALQGKGLQPLTKKIIRVLADRTQEISTHALTECVRRENQVHNPKGVKFFYAHQAARHPPAFVFYVNNPDKVVETLRRHLVNSIRKKWGFAGTPIRSVFRKTGRQLASGLKQNVTK